MCYEPNVIVVHSVELEELNLKQYFLIAAIVRISHPGVREANVQNTNIIFDYYAKFLSVVDN